MLDKIKDALLNKWTVGGSLLVIGGVTLVGGNWMGDVLNRPNYGANYYSSWCRCLDRI